LPSWTAQPAKDWAEIRRLHMSEQLGIKTIARRLGLARNTVRAALAADAPQKYERPAGGSLADGFEPRIRSLLAQFPDMPATVIAERLGWEHSSSVLRARVAQLRPLYRPADPADRTTYEAGQIVQCDLWSRAGSSRSGTRCWPTRRC
jgi:transposase